MAGRKPKDKTIPGKPSVSSEEERELDIVEEAGMESFPASDPPARSPVTGEKRHN